MKSIFLVVALLFVGFTNSIHAALPDIKDQLKTVAGLTFQETTTKIAGYRQFELKFEQPTDHANSTGEKFQQRLVLLHRDTRKPMVLETSGYAIFGVRLAQVTDALKTNQIQVEHRFFPAAMPASRDWSKMTVEQSAHDFHRIVAAFKPIYGAKWLNTGASKGGMTSIFFRRFYPNDVDGTLALVAPLSFELEDRRYIDFVRNVDSTLGPGCGEKVFAAQKRLLTDYKTIAPLVKYDGDFTRIGGKEVAYEASVRDLPFAFWQYGLPYTEDCINVPDDDASPQVMAKFLDEYNGTDSVNGDNLKKFEPYYYQSGFELGGPANDIEMFSSLYRFLALDIWKPLFPSGTSPVHTKKTMADIEQWTRTQSDKILYIYGSNDPWSAGMYPLNPNGDTERLIVDGGNHSANLIRLEYAPRQYALSKLRGWLDARFNDGGTLDPRAHKEYLEDLNYETLRRIKIR